MIFSRNIMLYLNNPFLTSDRIIDEFEKQLPSLLETPPADSKTPSALNQFKQKLKTIFFQQLDKKASDQMVLEALAQDARFTSEYPSLKQVLTRIFSLQDTDDKALALQQLKAIPSTPSNIPVGSTFDALNQRYGYFNPPTPDQQALFTDLAIACRSMIVLIEKNNTPDDTLAYLYAYKLMALFVDQDHPETSTLDTVARDAFKLMSTINHDKRHPFHETLLVQLKALPLASDLSDRKNWQQLVRKHGVNALPFWVNAKKIEEKIAEQTGTLGKRAPHNLKEASAIVSLCTYERAQEDVPFAQLCNQCKIDEPTFNQCLDYIKQGVGWPKKKHDSVPDITIQGRNEADGFFWLKLPVTDKRALILGSPVLSGCCQLIGGDSEQCVKDAVSLDTNGLYVLVKSRKKGHFDLIQHGEINDKDFKIVGQSYVWKSMTGNLCLDSLECLESEVSRQAIKSILSDFANTLLQTHSDIQYVTVGQGGKTPIGLFDSTNMTEKMWQGHSYGDASRQYCIAQASVIPLNAAQDEMLADVFAGYPDDCIEYLKHYTEPDDSNQLMAILQKMFIDHEQRSFYREQLLKGFNQYNLVYALISLLQAKLLVGDNAQRFVHAIIASDYPEHIARIFLILQQIQLLSGDHINQYVDMVVNSNNPEALASIFSILQRTKLLLGDNAQQYIDAVINSKEQVFFTYAFNILQKAKLLSGDDTKRYVDAVINCKDPDSLTRAFETLQQADLLTGKDAQQYVNAVINNSTPEFIACAFSSQHSKRRESFAHAVEIMKKIKLWSDENILRYADPLITSKTPESLAGAFAILLQAQLLSGDNSQRYVNAVVNSQNPFLLAHALVSLQEANLLSGDNPQQYVDAAISILSKISLFSSRQAIVNIVISSMNAEKTKQFNSALQQNKEAQINENSTDEEPSINLRR